MNLVNYGILPVVFDDPFLYDHLEPGDVLVLESVREKLAKSGKSHRLEMRVPQKNLTFTVSHNLSPRMIDILLAGGLTNWIRDQKPVDAA